MEDKVFETISSNLKNKINWCDKHIGILKKDGDIANISAGDYAKLLSTSRVYMSEMDKIYGELNHLLYISGLLTVQQTSKLISLMKDFCIYRSDLKILSQHSSGLELPKIPKDASYQFNVLFKGDIKIPARCSGKSIILINENTSKVGGENISNNTENTPQEIPEKVGYTFCHRGEGDTIDLEFGANMDDSRTKDFRLAMISFKLAERKAKKKKSIPDIAGLIHTLKESKATVWSNIIFHYDEVSDLITTTLVKTGGNKSNRKLYEYLDTRI